MRVEILRMAKSIIILSILVMLACACDIQDAKTIQALAGYWEEGNYGLEIRADGVMLLTLQETASYYGKEYPIYIVPTEQGMRRAIMTATYRTGGFDFLDLEQQEEFKYIDSWRFLELSQISQEFTYRLTDDAHLHMETQGDVELNPALLDLQGLAEFQVSDDQLTLRFPDRPVLTFKRSVKLVTP